MYGKLGTAAIGTSGSGAALAYTGTPLGTLALIITAIVAIFLGAALIKLAPKVKLHRNK